MKVIWKGVMPAVTTKFTANDTLDLKWFKHNIKAQLKAGVNGIILGGTLGEASTLATDEKCILIKETVKLAQNSIPVIVNIAEASTRKALEEVKMAEKTGANGLMVLPPMRYKADARETLTYFKQISKNTQLPIMIYNNPVDYGIEVTLEMFEELKEYQNIQAVKESTRDITNITRMKTQFGNRFKILCGVDTLALESLLMDADGWVAGLVCAFPKETVAIYKLVTHGEINEAKAIYKWFLPLLELDINTKLVQNIKLAEVATGLGTEYVRPPRLPLVGAERDKVLHIINTSLKTRPQLPNM